MKCEYTIDGIDVYKYIMPVINSNMYILIVEQQALIIDPNIAEAAMELLIKNHVEKVIVILTHEHYDHISGVNYFRQHFPCTVIGNEACKNMVTDPTKNMAAFFMALLIDKSEEERKTAMELLREDYSCSVDVSFTKEMEYKLDPLQLVLRETPGHSTGSICIEVNKKYIFTGDSLVDGAKIITRLPGGSKKAYKEITKPYLDSLNKDVVVFPGHGNEGLIEDIR